MSYFNPNFGSDNGSDAGQEAFTDPLSSSSPFDHPTSSSSPSERPMYPHQPPSIMKLLSEVYHLKEELRQKDKDIAEMNIKIKQQAETIQIHSKEMSKPQVDKMAMTPFRGYTHYGGNVPNLMQQPPPVFNPTGQQPTSISNTNMMQTKWGPITSNRSRIQQPFPRLAGAMGTSQILNPSRSFTPLGRNPNPTPRTPSLLSRMENINLDPQGNIDASVAGSSLPALPPPIENRVMTNTPTPSTGSAQDRSGPSTPQGQIQPNPAALGTAFVSPIHLLPSSIVSENAHKINQIAVQWNTLFDSTIRFAYSHLNTPSNQMDSRLPQDLKDKLMAAATQTTAARLLAKQDTRYMLVARLILEWILRVCIREDLLHGLDLEVDEEIEHIRSRIPDRHEIAKFGLIADILDHHETLIKHDNFDRFINHQSRVRTNQLLSFIHPLKYNGSVYYEEEAYGLIHAAHKLQVAQLLESTTFRPFFNNANENFDAARMVNMDNVFGNMSGQEIIARQGVVKLTIVPQIMSRTAEEFGPVRTAVMVKSGVLLKFKDHMVQDLMVKN